MSIAASAAAMDQRQEATTFGTEFNIWVFIFNSQQFELSFQCVLVIKTSSNSSRLVSAWNKGSTAGGVENGEQACGHQHMVQSHSVTYQQKRPRD